MGFFNKIVNVVVAPIKEVVHVADKIVNIVVAPIKEVVHVADKIVNIVVAPIKEVVHVADKVVDTVVDAGQVVIREGGKAIEDTGKLTYDVTESIVKTQFNIFVDLSNIPQLLDNPNKYFDQLSYDTFMSVAQPLGIAIGDKELAMQITYWAFVTAAIVASIFLGPEIAGAVDAMLAVAMEMIADAVVLNATVATILYFSMLGIGVVSSSFLIASLSTTLLNAPIDSYQRYYDELEKAYASLYALEEKNKRINQNYLSMYIDGSMNEWMAGGKLYDAPRAGGETFNPMGSMNTTMFLGMENNNSQNSSMVLAYANPNVSQQHFGNLAGNDGFSVLNFG